MKPGDKVNWLYEPRGGYGYTMNVAAVVVKIGPRRVQIRAARHVNGVWVHQTRWVSKERLSSRAVVVPEVDNINQETE
ncbi:MAG: hypothetical protein KDI64_09370 [Candidatus Accumulibacter sp.]|nr:hypothetical protein [Accumulibacter sp.]